MEPSENHDFIMFQDDQFCRRFWINDTAKAGCHGTYLFEERFCGGYPMYINLNNRGRKIFRAYTGKWHCTYIYPEICYIATYDGAPQREKIEGKWGWSGNSYVICQD